MFAVRATLGVRSCNRAAAVSLLALAGAVAVAPTAHAGEVTARDVAGAGFLSYEDKAGVADALTIESSTDRRTIFITGPGVTAGGGCTPISAGASCVLPAGSAAWDQPLIDLGGGNDRVEGATDEPLRLFGGAGDDVLVARRAKLFGMDGNDELRLSGGGTLDGGAGNDVLAAAGSSAFVGGPGADQIAGSPARDVIVDVGDAPSGDAISCGGGADVRQADPGDAFTGCAAQGLGDLTRVRHRWRVFGGGLTQPRELRVRTVRLPGLQSAFASCSGRACHGARLTERPAGSGRFRIARGGVRVPGRSVRAVRADAVIRAGIEYIVENVHFRRLLEFHTRARQQPIFRVRCSFAVVVPPATRGRFRDADCS